MPVSTDLFDRSEILPADPVDSGDMEVLHDREYRVRAFRKDPNLLIRGAVRDQKPPGLYLRDDDAPMTIHHMQLDIEVAFPSLVIVDASLSLEVFPTDTCQHIEQHYDKLIGLSIARGFTHKVRELFGGPRGCTHSTALLQAMAPVAIQCFWSMSASNNRRDEPDATPRRAPTPQERERDLAINLNTCHVWAEDGDAVTSIRAGTYEMAVPVFMRRRLAELGRELSDWRPIG